MGIKKEEAHVRTGLRSILSNPVFFDKFQKLLGLSRCKRRYAAIIKLQSGMKILDIGCGTADIIDHLPPGVDYHGYDLQPEYIDYAAKKYKGRGKFYCQDVESLEVQGSETFDVVMVNDIVHHLGDDNATRVFRIAHSCLKKGGFLCTIDIIKIENQSWLARYIMSKDRGQNVRTREEYLKLLKPNYEIVEEHILNNMYYVPYTNIVIKGKKRGA